MNTSMENLYFIINDNFKFTLQVDLETYQQLLSEAMLAKQYLLDLIKIRVVQIESGDNISSILMSIDGTNFEEIMDCDSDSINKELDSINKESSSEMAGFKDQQEENIWKDNETKFLLDKYEHYLPQVGSMKKFKKKKCMWQQIATDIKSMLLLEKTATQCENRFKTIMKRKKSAETRNNQTGERPSDVEFEDELAKIAAIDDSVSPEVQMSVGKSILKVNSPTCSRQEKSEFKKKEKASISKTLWDIQKFKEEQRERRHKEKMDLLRTIGERLCENQNEDAH